MEILEKIDNLKALLEFLLKTNNLNDKSVVKVSQELDKLLLEYYKEQNENHSGKDTDLNNKLQSKLSKFTIERAI